MSKINAILAEALKSTSDNAEKSTTVTVPASKPKTATTSVKKTAATKESDVKPAEKVAVKINATATQKIEKEKLVKEKTPKFKMERDSFTMPKTEYAQFTVLKERLNKLGQPAKKSELLRAGMMQLSAMTDAALTAAMSKVPAIKTGRPKKK